MQFRSLLRVHRVKAWRSWSSCLRQITVFACLQGTFMALFAIGTSQDLERVWESKDRGR